MKKLGICLLITGLIVTSLAIAFYFVIPILVDKQVASQVVIDSPNHPSYASQFLSNSQPDAPQRYNKINFFHLLNEKEFLEGQEPRFEERGPYVFRETYKKNRVQFLDDGNIVSFTQSVQNHFVPEMSNGTLDDQITIINLPYIKVMSRFGSESTFLQAAGTKVIPVVISEMSQKMIPAIVFGGVSQAITRAFDIFKWFNGGTDQILRKMGGDCGKDNCDITTTPLFKQFKPILSTNICNCSECACSVDKIPLETMKQLMNSSDLYAITNQNQDQGVSMWLGVSTNPEEIQKHFNLTETQFTKIKYFLSNVSNSEIIRSAVFDKLNAKDVPESLHVKHWTDIPYRQFLVGDVLSRLVNNTKTPISVQPMSPPEFPFFVESLKKLQDQKSYLEAKAILNNLNLNSLRCFEFLLTNDQYGALFDITGLRVNRPDKIEDFLRPSLDVQPTNITWLSCVPNIKQEYTLKFLNEYAQYSAKVVLMERFQNVTTSNGGLVTTRSVQQHAIGMPEPLLRVVLEPSDPRYNYHALLVNDTQLDDQMPMCVSTADVDNDYTTCGQIRVNTTDVFGRETVEKYYERVPSAFFTGKSNIDLVGQFVNLNGNRSIDGVFTNGYNLTIDGGVQNDLQYGFSNAESFPPFNKIKEGVEPVIYVPALTVSLAFQYEGEVSDLYDLKLKRFAVKHSEFTRERKDASMLAMLNSPEGIINITETKAMPLYVSTPHFYGYKTNISVPTNSTPEESDYEKYWSFIDIEPHTGKTLRAKIRGQVVTSTSETQFDVFYPKVHKSPLLPAFWKEIHAEVNQELAENVKIIYKADFWKLIALYVGVSVGGVLILLGLFVLIAWPRIRKTRKQTIPHVGGEVDYDYDEAAAESEKFQNYLYNTVD